MHDFNLLSELDKRSLVVDKGNKIPTVSELVNQKWGKHHHKDSKEAVPLKVPRIDTGHGEDTCVGDYKV